MTDLALIERITRSLAFMLRHQPETFDLELDTYGFADLEDVVQALNERLGEPVEEEDVREAVSAGDRPRYEIQGERIRALYGHSIPVDPGPSAKPPEFLYVAVPEQEVERARRFGLRGGRRRFLHLATSKEDAAESGRRASRDYTVLLIHALDAWEEGISFYDRHALWLAEEVPTNLLEVEGSYHDGTDPLPRTFDGPRQGGGGRERERGGRGHDRGHERSRSGGGQGGGYGGHGGGGGGRGGRGRGGRDRQEFREPRGGQDRPLEPRQREPEREATFSAPVSEPQARRPESYEREPRRDERPPRDFREPAAGSAPTAERPGERGRGDSRPRPEGRGDGRGDGRREGRPEGRRDERRPERADERRPEERRPEDRRPEERPRFDERREPARDERRGPPRDEPRGPAREEFRPERPRNEPRESREPREPARERMQEPASRPAASAPRGGGGGGFGAGIKHSEESRPREDRSAPPAPRPSAPAPRQAEKPVENDRPGFGAGL